MNLLKAFILMGLIVSFEVSAFRYAYQTSRDFPYDQSLKPAEEQRQTDIMDDLDIVMPSKSTSKETCRKIWLKDGNCDSVNNKPECSYDEGDCCRQTCLENCGKSGSCMFNCGQQNRYNCTQPSATCSSCVRGTCKPMGKCMVYRPSILTMINSCYLEPWSQGNYSTTSYFCGKGALADSESTQIEGLDFDIDQCTTRACCTDIELNGITSRNCDNETLLTFKVTDSVTRQYTTVSDVTCINFVSACFLANMRYRGQCCECSAGWVGFDCGTPICNPRCLHGKCTDYNTCSCDSQWSGELCDVPICKQGCIHGVCTEPNHCECYYGYTGEICDKAVSNPPCVRGEADEPDHCACPAKWEGRLCEIPMCEPSCGSHGYCVDVDVCECLPMYKSSSSTNPCDTLECTYFDMECRECNTESCLKCTVGYYLNPATNKCISCRTIDPLCIQCESNVVCTQCAYPYTVFSYTQCISYGVISFSTETLSVTEGETVVLKIIREYGAVGRVVIRLFTSSIQNKDELRLKSVKTGSYFEQKDLLIEFLDTETMKTVTLKTYRDTTNERIPKRVAIVIEYKEGVTATIGRSICTLYIYDHVTADSYHSFGKIDGFDGVSIIKGVPMQMYTAQVYSYADLDVEKTDGKDMFFGVLELQNGTDIFSITSATYNLDNLYTVDITLPVRGEYKETLYLAQNGVNVEYYRNMIFGGSPFVERIEDYFPRDFTEDVKSGLISVRITALLKADLDGLYTLFVSGAIGDKFTIFINNTVVIEFEQEGSSDTACSSEEVSAEIEFNKGKYYLLKVEYVHGEGEPCINLRWSSPESTAEPIPLANLYAISSISASFYLFHID